jgi:hypothetical protein
MEKVVETFLKGETSPMAIARQLNMTRAKVVEYLDTWKQIARDTGGQRDRANEALREMDVHFGLILKEMWAVVEDPIASLQVKSSTLKAIADVEAKRQDVLYKAGMYNDSAIGDELIAMEHKAEQIQLLLKKVVQKYPETQSFILEGLQEIFGMAGTVEASQ